MATIIERAVEHIRARSAGSPIPPGMSVTINFHPDLRVADKTVIEHLVNDRLYRSQFKTGTSSGGLTAFPGGERWDWESGFFAGLYDHAHASIRPKYGALNHAYQLFGGSVRFGSCHLRLRPQVLARTTFCYPESHFGPEAFGVTDRMALLERVAENARDLDPLLDNYIEAHVHGTVSFAEDVEAIVLDPSYRGTLVEDFASKLGCDVEWHPGFQLQLSELLKHETFRPPPALDAIQALHIRTPADIGALRGGRLDFQTAKWVWHCVAAFGGVG